jgi:hypothetical protein
MEMKCSPSLSLFAAELSRDGQNLPAGILLPNEVGRIERMTTGINKNKKVRLARQPKLYFGIGKTQAAKTNVPAAYIVALCTARYGIVLLPIMCSSSSS